MSSIRHRILLVLLGVGFLPLLLVFLVSKTITSRDLENAERDKLAVVGREIARQVSSVMRAASNDLESLRTNRVVTDPGVPMEERMSELRRLVKAYPSFSDITIYDPSGLMDESTTEGNHPEPQDFTSWLEKARDEGVVCTSNPHRILGLNGLHIKVYIPIHLEGQDKPSILKARLNFDAVWELIDGVKVGTSGEMFVIDGHGKILAARNKDLVLEKFDARFPYSHWANEKAGTYTNQEGKPFAYDAQVLTEHETYVGEPWTVLSVLPEDELTAVLRQSEIYQYATAIGALSFALILGLAFSKKMAEPIVLASEAAQRVSHGDLNAVVPETGPLEMKRLATSFNQMIEEVKGSRNRLESLVDSRTQKLRQSQSELEDLTSQLRAAYDSTREAILVVKPDGAILAANRRIQEFFNVGKVKDIAEMPFKKFQQQLAGSFSDEEDPGGRWNFFEDRPDGVGEDEWEVSAPEARTLSVYTAPVKNHRGKSFARLWMFSDVTENRRLEQSLQQAQKMEAIGRLAGGVAHDFNNLLTGIIGNLSLAEMECTKHAHGDSDADRFISSAKKAGQRAAELVKQLLGFSRRSHLQLTQCDVNDLILEVQELLTHTIDPRIQIKVDLPDVIWNINADATQVSQVLMNMCVNATDAMPETGGRISLSTRNVHISEEQAVKISGSEPGAYVRISVEDNGSGMPPEVQEKIFEPFFTTKAPGKGTGLGLATSYGIIRQHGGWLVCESEDGVGTRFHIYLPRVDKPALTAASKDVASPAKGGSETVLLVDDEEVVRAVAVGTLKHHGYTVVCAGDGEEALEIIAERNDIDVVILDLTMPRLSGRDTFRRIQEHDKPLPVIICSGYLVDLNVFEEETGGRPAGFVQKPFNLDQLANAIDAALHAEGKRNVVA